MSNLPITNSVSMNQNYLPQARELPKADNARDPLLSKAFTNAVVDNGAALKGGNVMVNRDALERLFDMFESAVRAIRTLLSNQGILPKSTPDAGALKDLNPDSTSNSDKSLRSLPRTDSKLKTAAETDPKTQLLSNTASKMLRDAGTPPHVSATNTLKSKLPSEPTSAKTPKSSAMMPGEDKTDGKLLSGIAAKVMSDAPLQTPLLSGKPNSTLPADGKPQETKSDAKSLPDITAKALTEAAKQFKVMREAKMQSPVVPAKDPKVSPEVAVPTKTLHRDVPGVKLDTAQENKQATDINVNVQVINCGFHHPEANIISHRWDTPHIDRQPNVKLKTPDQPQIDGQPAVKPKTPDQPPVEGQPSSTLNKPHERRGDSHPPLVLGTLNKPKDLSTPDKPNIDGKSSVATPKTDTQPEGPLPAFTPEPRPKLDLTAPGPADDQSVGIFNSRNRNRFDNARA